MRSHFARRSRAAGDRSRQCGDSARATRRRRGRATARAVSALAGAVISFRALRRYSCRMTHFPSLDRALATNDPAQVDRALTQLHIDMHDRPLDHLRVHLEWMRVQVARGAYARAAFHVLAGFVFAVPASLVQRSTGMVVPAFDRETVRVRPAHGRDVR
jgi:hypothetical protein